jgi:hypothetical protein
MGGKNNDNDAADRASKIAMKMYRQTDPARQMILEQGQDFLAGDYDVSGLPTYDPAKRALEDQYQMARQNIIANLPTGGAQAAGMTDLETQRANQLSNLTANLAQDQYNKIYGTAMLTPQTSSNTLASLAGSQAGIQAQQQGNPCR